MLSIWPSEYSWNCWHWQTALGGVLANSSLAFFESSQKKVSFYFTPTGDTLVRYPPPNLASPLPSPLHRPIPNFSIEEHPPKIRLVLKYFSSHVNVRRNPRSQRAREHHRADSSDLRSALSATVALQCLIIVSADQKSSDMMQDAACHSSNTASATTRPAAIDKSVRDRTRCIRRYSSALIYG